MKSNQYHYRPFLKWTWKNYDSYRRVDIDDFIFTHESDLFFIGTDSKNSKKKNKCIFTTVLVAYKFRKGGSVITHTDGVKKIESLRQRLLMEAMRSLETAWYLDSKISNKSIIKIHLDVNDNLRYESAKYKNELIGLIMAQNFEALIKPYAWAATTVADSRVN